MPDLWPSSDDASATAGGGDDETPAKRRRLRSCCPGVRPEPQSPDSAVSETAPWGEPSTPGAAASCAVALPADAEENGDVCAVCLEPLAGPAADLWRLGHCGHTFHIYCILQAFRKSRASRCPLCRGTGDRPSPPRPLALLDADWKLSAASEASCLAEAAGELTSTTPEAHFRLVTDLPDVDAADLPGISSSSFRSLEQAMSSLGRNDLAAPPDGSRRRLVFGRAELLKKVPSAAEHLMIPNVNPAVPSQPASRFVHREVFLLEFLDAAAADGDVTCGTGDAQLQPAFVSALTAKGLRICSSSTTGGVWRWYAEGMRVELRPGSRLALLLEALDGVSQLPPNQDILTSGVRCVLGLELVSLTCGDAVE